jgi:hypothetical protein
MVTAYRDRVPALVLVALLHIAAVIAFLNALIIEREPQKRKAEDHETQITLTPAPPPPRQIPRQRRLPATGGSSATTMPYFNPYTFNLPPSANGIAGSGNGIALALSACDPGRYDLAPREVRAVCDRIGMAVRNDPGHFGVVSEVNDPKHWTRELARREAPHLLPCMKAHAPPVAGSNIKPMIEVDLQTLLCVSRILFVGYDSEKHERYSE